ncbi:MAG: 5'-methylthioadenosine/S-adenosylhomocysteine nucleosidase [Bacteroidales bacterium]|nr:5'-methylthioadenosine/S-adenosylhomocysteine nucleosidase [Bacteroidales bacterium]
MKIGIMVAMDKELEMVSGLRDSQMICIKSGVGKVNAASAATRLIVEEKPDCLISTGCAGGLAKGLKPMDVVVSERTCYHDVDCGPDCVLGQIDGLPLYFDANASLYRSAMSLKAESGSSIYGGLICSGDMFCWKREQSDSILQRFPDALAVDMESAAIAQVCRIYDIPFISFRIISDTNDKDDRVDDYLNFWDEAAGRSFDLLRQFTDSLL